jgi:hypothetical protein
MQSGCPWEAEAVCEHSAMGGAVEVLMLLRELHCLMDLNDLGQTAAAYGHSQILDYCAQQGATWSAGELDDMIQGCAIDGFLDVVQWLRQHDAAWPRELGWSDDGGIDRWHADVLAWAREQGCTSPEVRQLQG